MEIRRILDPVHRFISFDESKPIENLVFRLIDTPEFQRLRRIRQLGFTDAVYPGATHTRFAHSIGVFHTARMLVAQLRLCAERKRLKFDEQRAEIALCAALLHDIGHGPFSHCFEHACQGLPKSEFRFRSHEQRAVEMILAADSGPGRLLADYEKQSKNPQLRREIARMIFGSPPRDIYSLIISSQFDADRLDYLLRDKLMTGVEHGGFDRDWLIQNLDFDNEGFVVSAKGMHAAESFLIGRFHLHRQVYLHKSVRGFELTALCLFRRLAFLAHRRAHKRAGLDATHPLCRFFGKNGDTISNYFALDDSSLLGSLEDLRSAPDHVVSACACALSFRRGPLCFEPRDRAEIRECFRQIRHYREKNRNIALQKDNSCVFPYKAGQAFSDGIRIQTSSGAKDIRDLSPLIRAISIKSTVKRLYLHDGSLHNGEH